MQSSDQCREIKAGQLKGIVVATEWEYPHSLINEFWHGFTLRNPDKKLYDGLIFEVIGTNFHGDQATFYLRKSRVAEMYFSRHIGRRFAFCHTAVLVYDDCGKFVVVVMASHTADGRRAVLPGGSIDENDLVGNEIDFRAAARREISEELGVMKDEARFRDRAWIVKTLANTRFSVIIELSVASVPEFVWRQSSSIDTAEITELVSCDASSIHKLAQNGIPPDPYLPIIVSLLGKASFLKHFESHL
jgi:8-oxo-dGTP pyrophosphatase MutT (NUDIX family)